VPRRNQNAGIFCKPSQYFVLEHRLSTLDEMNA
jgi:hypothetical protein